MLIRRGRAAVNCNLDTGNRIWLNASAITS
jgi:hypothetical protein